ncbi:MAG: hypothetical protein JHD35_14290 [Sphingopyxis sp.]|nr:hypothetical protein [Sphingopyxis sp.]
MVSYNHAMLTIFMPLLDEGTECWRPVGATPLGTQLYKVEGEVPQDETWAFLPGSIVICEIRKFQSGESGMTAIALAP